MPFPSFNPLKRAKKATVKNGLLTRVKDTYDVIAGSPNAPENMQQIEAWFYSTKQDAQMRKKPHLGVFDFITLGIHALSEAAFVSLAKYIKGDHSRGKKFLAFLAILPVAAFYMPLKLVNIIFGLIGTLITLPITLLFVHPIAKGIEAYKKNEKNKISYDFQNNDDTNPLNGSNSLSQLGGDNQPKTPPTQENTTYGMFSNGTSPGQTDTQNGNAPTLGGSEDEN